MAVDCRSKSWCWRSRPDPRGPAYDSPSQATALLQHPALRATGALREIPDGQNWICGTPFLLDAVEAMRDLRRDWEATQ